MTTAIMKEGRTRPKLARSRSFAGPALTRVTFVDPASAPEWDACIAQHGSLFHTSGWFEAVRNSFRHRPFALAAYRDYQCVGVLPLFLVNSSLTGRRLVSVPYGVGGGAVFTDPVAQCSLESATRKLMADYSIDRTELRCEKASFQSGEPLNGYVKFEKPLPDREEDVLGTIPRKARAVIRQATSRHFVILSEAAEQLDLVWRLYAQNMRRLGSITYPFKFFENLIRHVPDSRVTVAWWRGKPVAGLLSFAHRDTVLPYFYGCTGDARACGAAHYLYYDTMCWAVRSGLKQFDFGRSRIANQGSFEFKRLMGFEPTPLEYQVLTAENADAWSPPNPDGSTFRLVRRVWPYLPGPVTNCAGGILSEHIPG